MNYQLSKCKCQDCKIYSPRNKWTYFIPKTRFERNLKNRIQDLQQKIKKNNF
jgi:hypothetical protein